MASNSPASAPSARPRPAAWLVLIPLVIVGVGLWWGWGRGGAGSTREAGGAVASARQSPSSDKLSASVAAPARTPEEMERQAQRTLWKKRLQRARFTLDTYVAGTRYPPESRPMREHPDQEYPAAPERTRPIKRDHPDVQLRLKQDKIFVTGDEVVHFYVGCENVARRPLPCQVTNAIAHQADHMLGGQAPPAAVPLAIVDDGTQGDVLAGDGTSTARFQPSRQGFPSFSGTLRVSFEVRSGKAEGRAFFDILFTPSPPAHFTGKVREVVEQGSLQLYLGIQVRKAGRYVVAGRVEDETGVAFGYVSFNEELPAGAQEVKLTLFGKLLLDEAPTFPLKLRDVEGFLLKEVGDPDRELMTTLRGYVHTTREYAPSSFSADEWQSDERTRHIDEFTRDVKEAEKELDALSRRERAP